MDGENRIGRRTLLSALGGLGAAASAGCIRYCQPGGPGGSPGRSFGGHIGTGEAGERFYQDGPPNRNGETITATEYGSLQDAHGALQPGDTLHIPAESGPYSTLDISGKDHVTIASDGDGAWIKQSGSEPALGSSAGNRTRETSLTQPVDGGGAEGDGVSNDVGDTVLHVADASSFSPGDDIYIVEQTRPYSDPRSGGAAGPGETEELRTVTGVDHESNTLQVHYPMFLPFPMESQTAVGHVEWAATDVRVAGLNVRGSGGGSGNHAVEFHTVKNGWFDNLRIQNAADDSLAITSCYQTRTDGIDMIEGGGYGITIRGGSTHTYCTESLGDDIMNYVVRVGGSAVDVLADGVVGRNFKASPAPVCASHWGGFYVTYKRAQAEDQLARYRTRQMIIDGFEVTDCRAPEIVFSQRPFDVLLRDGRIGGYPSDANEKIFYFRLRGDDSPYGNEEARNIRIEDVRIEQLGSHGPEDIGVFDSNAIIDGLYINATYGGQPVTRQHVEQWERFNQATINNLVVE